MGIFCETMSRAPKIRRGGGGEEDIWVNSCSSGSYVLIFCQMGRIRSGFVKFDPVITFHAGPCTRCIFLLFAKYPISWFGRMGKFLNLAL